MPDKNHDRMKQLIEEKHHDKDSMHHEKVMKKMGKTHQAYRNQKHGGPLSKV